MFCDSACQAAFHAVPDANCLGCGGPIPRRPPSAMARARFCGNLCKFAWQATHPARPRAPRITQPCATCGDPVTYLPSQRGAATARADLRSDAVYCSRKCFGVGHSKVMTGRRPSGGIYSSAPSFQSTVRSMFADRCAICGWDEAPCDVAHIIARKAGGKDTFENVVMLCPNHHRMYDRGKITEATVRAARPACLRAA